MRKDFSNGVVKVEGTVQRIGNGTWFASEINQGTLYTYVQVDGEMVKQVLVPGELDDFFNETIDHHAELWLAKVGGNLGLMGVKLANGTTYYTTERIGGSAARIFTGVGLLPIFGVGLLLLIPQMKISSANAALRHASHWTKIDNPNAIYMGRGKGGFYPVFADGWVKDNALSFA